MEKAVFEEKFKACKKETKLVKVIFKNGDIAYANKFVTSIYFIDTQVWLSLYGKLIIFTKYRHIKDVLTEFA